MSTPTLDLLMTIPDHPSLDSVTDMVTTAEEMGIERVSLGETTGWNAVTTLTLMAERTEEIGISNDVFSPYSRSPALLAQTAAALQEASDGRYRIGIAPSSPALVEQWHGQSFERPLRRTREAIEIVRQALSGERVTYEGEIFELGGLSMDCDPVETPIDTAVLGPKAVEMTGRFADGWVPQLFTPDGLRDRLEDLERGADLGDRSTDDVRVAPILRCCALEDREKARDIARQAVAFLIGAYGPYYRKSVERQGWEEVAASIREAWEAGERERMAEELPDELLDELAAAGTPAEVREKVESYGAIEGVDAVRVGFFPRQSMDAKYATLEALEPLL
ncbi:MAG: TIGR04024 family LLM class F420-dependent oxidoreductase [Haloarculaceae archaeon]